MKIALVSALMTCCAVCSACTPAQSHQETYGEAVAAGQLLYRTNGCAACHGPDGHGDGPLARTLTPAPRDFRRAEQFKTARTAQAVAAVIAAGIPSSPAPMPAYAHLDEADRSRLAAFILSIGELAARTQ